MGEIDFFPNKRLVLDLTIIEHAEGLENGTETKQLYADQSVSNKAILTAPVPIRPKKIYEIRLHPTTLVGVYKHSSFWEESNVNLDGEINIKLHLNSLQKNESRRGLVTSLFFNTIE